MQTELRILPAESSQLEDIKNRLVGVYHPLKIYLFGSYAWGTPNKDSDFDIAIVIKESTEKSYKRILAGTKALWDINKAIDILVYTEDEFNDKVNHPSTLQYQILHKGVSLYETA